MPRKPRFPPEPRASIVEALEASGHTVHRISGELRRTLDAMLSASSVLSVGFEEQDPAETFPDFAGEEDAELFPLAVTMRVLARSLLATTLGGDSIRFRPQDGQAPLGMTGDFDPGLADMLARTLLPASLPPVIRPSRAQREEALDDVSRLVHEVGLEDFDASCHLEIDHDGEYLLVSLPIAPETAHVQLLEPLLERAEILSYSTEPLLAMERTASMWEFERWSAGSLGGNGRGEPDFPRSVREQEYSLVDRATMTFEASIVAEMVGGDDFAELFPRQYRVAEALLESFVGVFECIATREDGATLRQLTGAATFEIHEHMAPPAYAEGWIAMGRLLPFAGGLHLRSPGMIFFPTDTSELGQRAADAFAGLATSLPPALALEGVISALVFGVPVPREVKPARSRAHARELLQAAYDALADTEFQTEVTADEAPEDLRAHGEGRDVRFLELTVDPTVGAYTNALAEQAGLTAGGEGAKRSGGSVAKRKKPKGKPRRPR
jgi:hypothetical protein